MKKIALILLVVILGIAGYYWYMFSKAGGGDDGPKQSSITLKKHSAEFNDAVAATMKSYFDMSASFVDADTANVKEHCRKFIQLLDSIPMDELKKDTASIYEVATGSYSGIRDNATSLLMQTDLTEMRKDFSMVSENLYPFFKIINYEGENMYWQNCPMAFGDDKGANWISSSKDIINPYLGKNHPEFKGAMLHCGSVKDTIKAQ